MMNAEMTRVRINRGSRVRRQEVSSRESVLSQKRQLLTRERIGDLVKLYELMRQLESTGGYLPSDALWPGARALQKYFLFEA